jgi:methyl-accepting chemotaxis protein
VRISLRNRLTAVFFAINLIAFGALYVYVAPGLQGRLMNDKLQELATQAERGAGRIVPAAGRSAPMSMVRREVDAAALQSGARVTLLRVRPAGGGVQLQILADSSNPAAATPLAFTAARSAISRATLSTATENVRGQVEAEAAWPVLFQGRAAAVIVYSASVADIVKTVAEVRHDILVAGAIGLLLALLGGYILARAIALRLKRVEVAARQVAAGDFDHRIEVGSGDELGQLARAFNQMQHRLAQLDSARKKFIATASHELRTPIFSLGGFVELLEDEDLDAETRQRFLEQVKDQVERLRRLSVNLLDLSQLESGTLELRPEQVDLGELARSVSGADTHGARLAPRAAVHAAHDRRALRPGPGRSDPADPDRQCPHPHPAGHADRRDRPGRRRAGPTRGPRRWSGHRSGGASADLRALLHR